MHIGGVKMLTMQEEDFESKWASQHYAEIMMFRLPYGRVNFRYRMW